MRLCIASFVTLLLLSCVSPPTNPNHPWLVGKWEESLGVGSGKTDTSGWNHLWDEASIYTCDIAGWDAGPTLRYFRTFNGKTNEGFEFENETTGFGLAAHRANHSGTLSETTLRITGQRRTERGTNDRIALHTKQETSLLQWSATYVCWPQDELVREWSLWIDHSLDIARTASTPNEQHKTEFRLGALTDLWHSSDRNLTLGIGLEHIMAQEERTGRRMTPLVRVRVLQRWTATACYSDFDDARGISIFYRLWGNE